MAEYLDKEAFKKSVEERYCKPCKAEKKDHNGCWCRACWVDDMLDDVECFQPAAYVAPVVHGRWAHLGGDEWCCSAPGGRRAEADRVGCVRLLPIFGRRKLVLLF